MKSKLEKNNIKAMRLARDLSLAKLADMIGTSAQQLHRLERGERRLHQDIINRLARSLGCRPSDIIEDVEIEKVPLVGYVGAGAEIFPIDDHVKGDGLEMLEMPIIKRTDIAANEILAVRVKGDSMLPVISNGWTIYYHTKSDIENCLRGLCVVKVKNGATFVKTLTRGSKPNLFTLTSFNASDIEDVKIEWAYRIISIEPR